MIEADLNHALDIEDLETEIAPAATTSSVIIEIILVYLGIC